MITVSWIETRTVEVTTTFKSDSFKDVKKDIESFNLEKVSKFNQSTLIKTLSVDTESIEEIKTLF